MGRRRKFTPATLRREVDRYFASITRRRKVTELVPDGKLDKYGHPSMKETPVLNQLGEEVYVTEYIVPPDRAGLSEFLHIHPSTWSLFENAEKHPEFQEVTRYVYERMKAWNEREMLTRPGKDIAGIKFNLENNYGYRERQTMELTGGGVEEYLRKLAEEGEGAQEF